MLEIHVQKCLYLHVLDTVCKIWQQEYSDLWTRFVLLVFYTVLC